MSKSKQATTDKSNAPQAKKAEQSFAFNKQNYILTIASVIAILVGFVLMAGKEDIFSTTKLTVAPMVVMGGFLLGVYAIMKKPRD